MLDENVDPTGPGEMCAPLNSINFSENQLAASRSEAGERAVKSQLLNNFVNNLDNAESDGRLETHDSIANDTTLSPYAKLMRKLKRYIMSSYKKGNQAPQTNIEFYRIGKILGKGAFGKVNLSLHQLT